MANKQNLKPFKKGEVSREQAAINGRKGGRNSAKAKKERKTFAQLFKTILDEEAEVTFNGEKIKITKKDLLARDLINKAIRNQVSNSALNGLKHIQATIGEAPIEKIEQTNYNIEAKPAKMNIEELKKIRKEVFGIE